MIQHFLGSTARYFTLAVSIATLSGGCASRPGQETWTTKQQSALGVRTDTPSLNLGDHMPPPGVTVSAAELREPALSVLREAAASNSPLLRANAIEALHFAPEYLPPILQEALGDANRGVRFVAVMSIGKLRLKELVPLLEPLLHDESESVQAAAIYALRRCGRPIDLNPLARMLASEDPEVKGNAALVLGELGDSSAVPLLRHAAGQPMMRVSNVRRRVVELQLAEAMVKLGATRELEVIRAAIFSPVEDGELAALACLMCGELRDTGALPDLNNLIRRSGKFERPAETRMAAALAIARIEPARAPVEVPVGYANHGRPELRAQAAYTLGAITQGKQARVALSHLSRLMSDSNPMVQVAAAGGILRMQASETM